MTLGKPGVFLSVASGRMVLVPPTSCLSNAAWMTRQ